MHRKKGGTQPILPNISLNLGISRPPDTLPLFPETPSTHAQPRQRRKTFDKCVMRGEGPFGTSASPAALSLRTWFGEVQVVYSYDTTFNLDRFVAGIMDSKEFCQAHGRSTYSAITHEDGTIYRLYAIERQETLRTLNGTEIDMSKRTVLIKAETSFYLFPETPV